MGDVVRRPHPSHPLLRLEEHQGLLSLLLLLLRLPPLLLLLLLPLQHHAHPLLLLQGGSLGLDRGRLLHQGLAGDTRR